MSGSDDLTANDRSAQHRIESHVPSQYFGFEPDPWQGPAVTVEHPDSGEQIVLPGSETDERYRHATDRPDDAQYRASDGREYSYHPHMGDADDGEVSQDGDVVEDAGGYFAYDPQRRNIDVYWGWVSNMSNEATNQHSTYWRRVSTALRAASDTLRTRANTLAETWQGEASTSYLSQIGATLYSLDEWDRISSENAWRLATLATQIEQAQSELGQLYRYYYATISILEQWPTFRTADSPTELPIYDPQNVDWHSRTDSVPNATEIMPILNYDGSYEFHGDQPDNVILISPYLPEGKQQIQQLYHNRAAQIIQELADEYVNAHYYAFEEGRRFQGPIALNPSPGGQPIQPLSAGDLMGSLGVPAGLAGGGMPTGPGAINMPQLPAGAASPALAGLPTGQLPASAVPAGLSPSDNGFLAGVPGPGLALQPGVTLPAFPQPGATQPGIVPPGGFVPPGVVPPSGLPGQSPGGLTAQQQAAAAQAAQAAQQAAQAAAALPGALGAQPPGFPPGALGAQPPGFPPGALGAQPPGFPVGSAPGATLPGTASFPAGTAATVPGTPALPGAANPGGALPGVAGLDAVLPGAAGLDGAGSGGGAPGVGPGGVPVTAQGTPALPGVAGGNAAALNAGMMPPPPPPMAPAIPPSQSTQRGNQGGANGTGLAGMPPPPRRCSCRRAGSPPAALRPRRNGSSPPWPGRPAGRPGPAG
jgi:hypothetical protein